MTSLVNTLKKAVSTKETDGLTLKTEKSLPATPSFSDFSLCAHADGETCVPAAACRASFVSLRTQRVPSCPATTWPSVYGDNAAYAAELLRSFLLAKAP